MDLNGLKTFKLEGIYEEQEEVFFFWTISYDVGARRLLA